MRPHSQLPTWLLLASTACAEARRPPGVDGARDGANGHSDGATGAARMDSEATERAGPYPEGPYGEANPVVGDVIENLRFVGFVGGSGTFSEYTLADAREEGSAYLLIHVAAAWCPSCRAAADDLSEYAPALLEAGGSVIELLHEGTDAAAPTEQQLRAWIEAHELRVTTVGPADERVKAVFPDREYAYIVELDSMEVVWRERGLYANPSIGEVAAEALLERL